MHGEGTTWPTASQRRDRHLEAGRRLLVDGTSREGAPWLALSHVRLSDVAEREGVEKSAMYYYWHSHQAFWRELLELLTDDGRLLEGLRAATSSCGTIGPAPAPRDFWQLGDLMFDTMTTDRALPVTVATLGFDCEGVSRLSLGDCAESAVDKIEAFLARVLPHVALRIAPERDARRLATSLLALLVGLSMQHRVAPGGVPTVDLGLDRKVSLYAAAGGALILESCDVIGVSDRVPDEVHSVRVGG